MFLACVQEQAVEREHERDEFQQEIKNLEAQLRVPSKGLTGGDSKGQRVRTKHQVKQLIVIAVCVSYEINKQL